MGKNNKKNGSRKNTKNITNFVFGGTPTSETMKDGAAGFETGHGQASSSSVSVTLNSVDTYSAEESSLSITHGGKKHHNATGFQRNTGIPQVNPLTNATNRNPDEGIPLQKVEVGEKVTIPAEGYPSLEEDWGFCLVGCFTGRFPGIKAIEDLVSSWHVQCKFLPHERGWVLFQFTSDEDRRIVLQKGPFTLFGKTLLLRILPQDFRFNFDAFMKVDVWVKFVNVPLRCWNKIALEHLGSRVGTPKRTDQGTKRRGRISYCRMLIEIDMSKELPTSFEVCLPDGAEYTQKIVYEGLPKYCFHCKKFGHNLFDCRVLHAQRLKKHGDFDAKHANHAKEGVEGNQPTTHGGRIPKKPRGRGAASNNQVLETNADAVPTNTLQPLHPQPPAKTDAVLGKEDAPLDPTADPRVGDKRKKKKKKKKPDIPREAEPSGLPCVDAAVTKCAGMETLGSATTLPKSTREPPPPHQASENQPLVSTKDDGFNLTLWKVNLDKQIELWYDLLTKQALRRVEDKRGHGLARLAPDKLREIISEDPAIMRDAFGAPVNDREYADWEESRSERG